MDKNGAHPAAPAAAILVALALTPGASHAKRPTVEIPLLVRVAACGGEPARPPAWIEAHLKATDAVLAPHAMRLRARVESFSPPRCELDTRAHRDELAAHVTGRVATVLIMRRVRDIDVSSYNLMGVHWRYGGKRPGYRGRRWVFLTARARPPVLAHELCHYFGLPHDPAGGNLMTPGPSAPAWRRRGKKPLKFSPVLTARQARRLRRSVRRYARSLAVRAPPAPGRRP